MRAEVAIDGAPADPTPVAPATSKLPRRPMDRIELGLLVAFSALSMWVLAIDAWQVVFHGRVWTGTDGVYIVDQMQYLAWIRDASHHVLAANLFVLRPTPADYFQPAVAISGALAALGLSPTLALLLWKPVAVVGLFLGVRSYVHRTIGGLWARRAALTLALFFGSFTVAYGSFTVLGDLFPVFLSWGYTFALLALAAMVAAIMLYERDRRRGRVSLWPGVLGAVASLLHPWHGELLALVLIGAELTMWRHGRRGGLALPLVTLLVIGAALVYYAVLGHTDPSWKLARQASKHTFSFWPIGIYLLPLALPALFGYRGAPRTFLIAATRSWPVASLSVFVLSATALGATPLHAFQGITIPLALLAVQGVGEVRSLRGTPGPVLPRLRVPRVLAGSWMTRRRLIWVIAIALATIPGTVMQLNSARQLAAPTYDNANFIEHDEASALSYLAARREPGGVLTRSYLGAIVPSRTGRHVLVGDCLWSQPGCLTLTAIAQQLFTGQLSAAAARRFVTRGHVRFVLGDCRTQTDLNRLLGPLIVQQARFGCATVLQLGPPGSR